LRAVFSAAEWAALEMIIEDYDDFAMAEIGDEHDTVRLIGQDNIRRYLPLTHLRIRIAEHDTPLEIAARLVAVAAAGGRAVVSSPTGIHTSLLAQLEELTHAWGGAIEFIEESDAQLMADIADGQVDRLRYAAAAAVAPAVRAATNAAFVYVADMPVSAHGRVELLWYVQEQSVCIDYHRYGNLGARANEPRREPR
jgi:RHH-type proline utilization regulon transcriptional repressor/proline dehydrogenase/delta 1-pyrroline-5-carboxylate dehydrogenase